MGRKGFGSNFACGKGGRGKRVFNRQKTAQNADKVFGQAFSKKLAGVGGAHGHGLSFLPSFFLWAFCLQRKKREVRLTTVLFAKDRGLFLKRNNFLIIPRCNFTEVVAFFLR